LISSLIKQSALSRGIVVVQPHDVNAQESLELIRKLRPDLLVTAAYGQILSPELLAIPTLGGINLHGSILPAYRGAAPVARAIQHGETETGVTIIRMSPRIDAGGMMAVARTSIGPDETAGELESRLALIGAPLIPQAIESLAANTARVVPQDRAKVTRAPKLSKEDSPIDWSLPASAIHNHVRALHPWPLSQTTWIAHEPTRGPLRLIIHRTRPVESNLYGPPGTVVQANDESLVVAAGIAAVSLLVVQIPGKKPLPATDFLRGHPVLPGDVLKS
jgi:methionyl-tRNA formyltransferase